jgi:hypothetical protein
MTFVIVTEEQEPIPVDARFKAWDYGRSLAGIVGSSPVWREDGCLSVVSVVCFK